MTLIRKSQNEATAVRGGVGAQGCFSLVAHLLLKSRVSKVKVQ